EPIRIVLEDEQIALARELDEALPALERQRAPARILEGRDRVQERRLTARKLVGNETVVVHPRADDLGAEPAKDLDRTVVRRRLDERRGAGGWGRPREDHDARERAARDNDARRLRPVPSRDPLAQRAVAAAGAVREDDLAVTRDRLARAIGQLVHRQA